MNTAAIRATWSIALYTWREGMRKKLLIAFLIFSILVIVGSNFITAFMQETTIGDAGTGGVDAKLIKDICMTAISIFGVLITIFISASVVPAEVENRVIYTVLSKPVRRFQYLLGKFIGVQMIVIVNLLLIGSLFSIAIYAKEQVPPTLLMWAVLLVYFEFLIVSAFTFAVSCTATSAVLPTVSGLFIYITGNLTEYLKGVAQRAQDAGQTLLGTIAEWLWYILPNLKQFGLREQILTGQANDPPQNVLIPNLIVYSLAFALAGYILSYWLFRRKEF